MSRRGRVATRRGGTPAVEWAGAILVNGRGELLLNLRDSSKVMFPGLWDVVGGTLEQDETPEECMLREIFEETGQAIAAIEYLQHVDVPLGDGHFGRLHLFRGEIDRPAADLLLGEGQEHRFFAPDQLESIDIVPGMLAVLQAYADAAGPPAPRHDPVRNPSGYPIASPAAPEPETADTVAPPR